MTNLEEIKTFGRQIVWLITLTIGVMVFGSFVRATGSGLACPDWPLCFGKLLPQFNLQIFIEWFHRLIAAGVAVLLTIIGIRLLRSQNLRKLFGVQLFVAGTLLAFQIILGGLTVLKVLDPSTVSAHLINALLFLALLIWVAVRAHAFSQNPVAISPVSKGLRRCCFALSGLIFIQMCIGGIVSSNFAGLACPDFPTCHGTWFPPPVFLIWAQMLHRFVGISVLLFAVATGFLAFHKLSFTPIKAVFVLIPTLIAGQIALGAVNVFYGLPVWASVSHMALGVTIFTLSVWVSLHLVYLGITSTKSDAVERTERWPSHQTPRSSQLEEPV